MIDPARRQPLPQLGGRGQAVAAGHLDVQQRHVRPGVKGRREHLVPARRLGDDLDVLFQREQGRERSAHHRLVLGEQHADGHRRFSSSASWSASGKLHAQAEPASGQRARLEAPPRRTSATRSARPERPLPPSCSPVRSSRRRRPRPSSLISAWTASVVARDADGAAARAAVADDVGRPLAHRPGQHGLHRLRQQTGAVLDPAGDAGGVEHLLGPDQLLAEGRLAVAGDRLAHLAQRPPRDRLGLADLLRRPLGRRGQEPAGQFALQRDQGEAVPEQVVQVAREAQALLGDGAPRQLLARGPQLRDGGDLAGERGRPQAERRRREHEPRQARGERRAPDVMTARPRDRHVGVPAQEHEAGGGVDVEEEHAPRRHPA